MTNTNEHTENNTKVKTFSDFMKKYDKDVRGKIDEGEEYLLNGEELMHFGDLVVEAFEVSLKNADKDYFDMMSFAIGFNGEELEKFIRELRISHAKQEHGMIEAKAEYEAEEAMKKAEEAKSKVVPFPYIDVKKLF